MEGVPGAESATPNRVVRGNILAVQVNARRVRECASSRYRSVQRSRHGGACGATGNVRDRFRNRERLLQLEKARGVGIGSRATQGWQHHWVRRTRCIEANRSKRAQAYSSVLSSFPFARTKRGGTSEAIHTRTKVPGIVASDIRGFERPRAAAVT